LFSAIIVNLMGIMYQAGTVTSNVYSNARDGITSVIIAVVALTITYFVVVVATEITILCTEESRRKALAKQRAKADGGEKGKKVAGGDKPGAAAAAAAAEDFNVGAVENQMNPMFLGKGGGGDGGMASSASANDAIMAQRDPPSVDLWRVFQSSYADLHTQVEALSGQLHEAKLALQRVQEGGDGDVGAAMPTRTGSRGRKAEFTPTLAKDDASTPSRASGAGGGGFANPLMSGRAGGGGGASGTPRANPLAAARAGPAGRSAKGASSLADLKRGSSRSRLKGAAAADADDE
jgi:hypothetical protein